MPKVDNIRSTGDEMIQNPSELIKEFMDQIELIDVPCGDIRHESLTAPHPKPKLPEGKCAVYIFSLSVVYGNTCPAGSHRVLKVGKAGPKSGARFEYQHYVIEGAPSTLAGMIDKSTVLWKYLGINSPQEWTAGDWIKDHTDRDHFFLDATYKTALDELEKYLKGRLGPVFEG